MARIEAENVRADQVEQSRRQAKRRSKVKVQANATRPTDNSNETQFDRTRGNEEIKKQIKLGEGNDTRPGNNGSQLDRTRQNEEIKKQVNQGGDEPSGQLNRARQNEEGKKEAIEATSDDRERRTLARA